jgi:phosphoglycolate phosphatase
VTEYDAIVYDLDGTLVRLDVDWAAVREQTAAVLTDRDIEVGAADIWTIRELAADHGVLDRVDDVIAEFEREGARNATRLALADDLPHGVPVGVCSLNAEGACRIALEHHGLDDHVDAVVGRGTVETVKPDPGPLLAALERLGVTPETALFVGDSDTDRVAAERAGTAFEWVSNRSVR